MVAVPDCFVAGVVSHERWSGAEGGISTLESLPHIKQMHDDLLDAKHHQSALLKRFGAWLRQEREHSGLTATELARRIGVSQVLITRIEHADAVLSEEKLSKIFEVLQLDYSSWNRFIGSGEEPSLQELAQGLHAQLQAARLCCPALVQEFGHHVRYCRCQRHWTEGDLALRAGVTKQTICGVEQGKMVPSATLIGHLAIQLELSLQTWLMPAADAGRSDLTWLALGRLWNKLSDGDKMLVLGTAERLSRPGPVWDPRQRQTEQDLLGLEP